MHRVGLCDVGGKPIGKTVICCGLGLGMLAGICIQLTFRHRASCILGQVFHYSPENTFYVQGGSNMAGTDLCVNSPGHI